MPPCPADFFSMPSSTTPWRSCSMTFDRMSRSGTAHDPSTSHSLRQTLLALLLPRRAGPAHHTATDPPPERVEQRSVADNQPPPANRQRRQHRRSQRSHSGASGRATAFNSATEARPRAGHLSHGGRMLTSTQLNVTVRSYLDIGTALSPRYRRGWRSGDAEVGRRAGRGSPGEDRRSGTWSCNRSLVTCRLRDSVRRSFQPFFGTSIPCGRVAR